MNAYHAAAVRDGGFDRGARWPLTLAERMSLLGLLTQQVRRRSDALLAGELACIDDGRPTWVLGLPRPGGALNTSHEAPRAPDRGIA